jgi:hypothetical protein
MKNFLLDFFLIPASVALSFRHFARTSGEIKSTAIDKARAEDPHSTRMVWSLYQRSFFSKAMEYLSIAFFVCQTLTDAWAQKR